MGVPLAGVGANIKTGVNQIANLDTWTISAKSAVKDTTSFQATGSYQQNTATIKSWTVKCDGRLDATDTNGQVALINGLGNTFPLELDIDAAGTHKWTGNAILTGIDPKADAHDVNVISFSFDGSGVLTFA